MIVSRFKRLAKEGGWIVFGQIVTVIASLVLVRVLTEHLDTEQYGRLALTLTLGTLVGQVAFAGAIPGIMRYYSIAAEKGKTGEYYQAAIRMMGYGALASLGLSALLLPTLLLLGKSDILALTGMAIIFTLLSSYNNSQSMIQNAARQRKVVAFHGSLVAWLKVILAAILLICLGNSPFIVLVAYILSTMLVLFSQAIFIRRLIPKRTICATISNQWSGKIWQYSKPFVFLNIFTWMQSSSDRWALETFTNTGDVGMYAVLIQLGYTPIAMATGLMTNLIAPILFQRSGDTTNQKRNIQVHKQAWQITFIALLLTLLACLLASQIHGYIFRFLVAEQYHSVSCLLPWMILAGGLFSSGQVLALKLMSELKTNALLWPKIVTSIIGVLASFGGAYMAGINGVIAGAVFFSVLQLSWIGFLSIRRIDCSSEG